MARVNRTTGTFLVLGVVLLLATVTGTHFLINPAKLPAPIDPPISEPAVQDVYAGAKIDIPGGVAALAPGIPGRVAFIKVQEDQPVKAGDVILVLDDKAEQLRLQALELAVTAAKAKVDGAKESAKNFLIEHQIKLTQQQHLVDTAKGALVQANNRFDNAEKNKDLSMQAKELFQQAGQQKIDARKAVETAEKALELLKSIDPTLPLKEHEENLKKAEKEVAAGKAALEAYSIKAPFDGRVIALNIRVGEQFGPTMFPGSQPPIVFCPEGDLIARVEVDQERAHLVKKGMTVTLHDKSPSRKHEWTGTVERVANWFTRPRGSAFEPDQMNDTRTCECIIRIKPDPKNPLMIGQQMRARIHIERK